jgi:2-haloacid dehalogenase
MMIAEIKALLFDVFGTVVDWRNSVIREGEAIGRAKGLKVDWPSFADAWRRDGYLAPIFRIARGEEPWERVDILHRRKLDRLLVDYQITGLSEMEIQNFNRVWHRLDPWPDAIPGLTRLRRKFLVAPLSNGDFALLTNMARHAGLLWDCILSSELFQKFKPNLEIYRDAVKLLDLMPGEVMMVAAHVVDLEAARTAGLRTAYVDRPLEFGPGGAREPEPKTPFDVSATFFTDLAEKLGA